MCRGGRLEGRRNVDGQGHVATAAGEDLLVDDPVEVDHPLAGQQREVDAVAADFAHLLHGGHHAFERRMGDVLRVEQGQHVGDPEPVVGAQRRAFRPDEVAVHVELHALRGEIVDDAVVDLAHHVDVTVQDDGRRLLVPRSAGLLDDDVLQLVAVKLEPALLSKVREIIRRLCFVARAAVSSA